MIVEPTTISWNILIDGLEVNILSIQAWFLTNRPSDGANDVLIDIIEGEGLNEQEIFYKEGQKLTPKELAFHLRSKILKTHKDIDIQNFINSLLKEQGDTVPDEYLKAEKTIATNKNYFDKFKNENLGNWIGIKYKEKYSRRAYLLARYIATHDPDSRLGMLLQSERENFELLRNGFKALTPDQENRIIDNQIIKPHRNQVMGYYRILRPNWKSGCQIVSHPFIATLAKITEIENSPYMVMQEVQAAPGARNGNPHIEIDWGYFMRRETDLFSLTASNQNATKIWCFCALKPGLSTPSNTTEAIGEMFSLKSIPSETLSWPFYMQRIDQDVAEKLENGVWQRLVSLVQTKTTTSPKDTFKNISGIVEELYSQPASIDIPESDQLIMLNHMTAQELPIDAANYFFEQGHARLKALSHWAGSLNKSREKQRKKLFRKFNIPDER